MKFLEMLGEFFLSPIEGITQWLDDFGVAIGDWWANALTSMGIGITSFLVDSIAIIVICYSVYCACRIMCCNGNDEKFSEYVNKTMISGLCYFFAKYGGRLILGYIGT